MAPSSNKDGRVDRPLTEMITDVEFIHGLVDPEFFSAGLRLYEQAGEPSRQSVFSYFGS